MRLKKGPPATVALLFLVGCATAAPKPCDSGMALLNASLWVQTAAEYRASARQTYNTATRVLDVALASPAVQPAAVILDLDETALDNSAFESRMVKKGISYDPKDWRAWVAEAQATAVPGAVEFLTHARSRGVTPFYITNRKTDEEADTRRNLEKLGFPLSAVEDNVLTRGERPEWQSTDKSGRRDYVASRYRVLMLIGDDLNDFVLAAGKSLEERSQIVESNAALWGTKWFVVPNPMYGSWEKAITRDSPECEALRKKMETLRE